MITEIYGIGTDSDSLPERSTLMRDEWEYPDWGVCIADGLASAHQQIMLDYRQCGPQGEPSVVWVDQEDDFTVTPVAPDFAIFIRGLVSEDEFFEADEDLADDGNTGFLSSCA